MRDTGASGTGVAPDRSGNGPANDAGLPSPDPGSGSGAPEMQTTPGRDRTPDSTFVMEGTIRHEASGAWVLETSQRGEAYELVGLPAQFQKDGLRTKVRLDAHADAPSKEPGRQAARVIEVGDVL